MIEKDESIKNCGNCAHNCGLGLLSGEIICEISDKIFPEYHYCDSFLYTHKPKTHDDILLDILFS